MKLKGKTALITGANTGLGAATIKKFLREGATVYATASSENGLPADCRNEFTFVKCDVRNEDDIEAVCEKIRKEKGMLDCLVTISEKLVRGGVAEVSADQIKEAGEHICMAPMLFGKYCNDLLHKSANPSITHNVPMSAYMTEKNYLNSSFSAAVVNYTRQCAPQLRPVRVNAVLFGILTDHLLTEEEVAVYNTPERLAKIPAGRLGTGADVANVTCFLASDKARYLNSAALSVDGGYYTMNSRSMGNNGV